MEQAIPVVPIAGPPPAAGLSTADASALLARTNQLEQDLAAERAQRARLEAADRTDKKSAAINAVLANAPLVAGTAAQVARLLADDIALHPDPTTGQLIAVGPGFKPAEQYIKEQLGKPEWGHFMRAQTPHGGTAGGPPGTQGLPTAPAWGSQPAPPQTLSEAIFQDFAGRQRPAADPALDLSQGFGLPGKRALK
jgi:hypothetical protein